MKFHPRPKNLKFLELFASGKSPEAKFAFWLAGPPVFYPL